MPEDLNSLLEINSQAGRTQQPPTPVQVADTVEAQSLTGRYKDGYRVAGVIVGVGSFIKGIGILVGVIIIIGGFTLASQSPGDQATAFGFTGLVSGASVGLGFYIWGVLVSALGQILKALIDNAVNTSPLLSNAHRVLIMSLR